MVPICCSNESGSRRSPHAAGGARDRGVAALPGAKISLVQVQHLVKQFLYQETKEANVFRQRAQGGGPLLQFGFPSGSRRLDSMQ